MGYSWGFDEDLMDKRQKSQSFCDLTFALRWPWVHWVRHRWILFELRSLHFVHLSTYI